MKLMLPSFSKVMLTPEQPVWVLVNSELLPFGQYVLKPHSRSSSKISSSNPL